MSPSIQDLQFPRGYWAWEEESKSIHYHWSDSVEPIPYIYLPCGIGEYDCPVLLVRVDYGVWGWQQAKLCKRLTWRVG